MKEATRYVDDNLFVLTKSKDKYIVYVSDRFSVEMIDLLETDNKDTAILFYTRLLKLYDIDYKHRKDDKI